MEIHVIRCVVCGFQLLDLLRVTGDATKGRVNLAVTNQAVGHLGQILLGRQICFFHPPMTRHAEIVGIEMRPDFSRFGKIVAAVDGCGERGSYISKIKVLPMTEEGFPLGGRERFADSGIAVAGEALLVAGKQVVRSRSARVSGFMTIFANSARRQMDAVGKFEFARHLWRKNNQNGKNTKNTKIHWAL